MQDNHRIFIIGNIAGGKTRLARSLAQRYNLPLTHVDSLQFLPGMKIRDRKETCAALLRIEDQERWVIDGYGPLDLIEKRFEKATQIVFIDLPLWRHFWWFIRRQVQNLWSRRPELPEGCNELTWEHTKKLSKTILQMHKQMRPELLRILAREKHQGKVIMIKTLQEWQSLDQKGF